MPYSASQNGVRFSREIRDETIVTDDPLKIDTTTSAQPAQKKHPRIGRWLMALAGLFCLLSVIALNWRLFSDDVAPPRGPLTEIANPQNIAQGNTTFATSVDDSEFMWISPTAGPPITLEYVPLGTQVILSLRPAELLANDEGEKVLATLGPWGEQAIQHIERLTGAKLEELQTLLVALHSDEGAWQYTLRATLVKPWNDKELAKRSPEITDQNRAIFLPKTGQGRVLVSCPRSLLAELEEQGETPAILARDLERLLPRTDADRTVNLLMPSKFLDTDGRELFLDGGEKLLSAFQALVPTNAGAVAVSLDWHDNFFCELQATIVQNAPAHRFVAKFAEQLQSTEQQMAALLESQPPHPYGQAIENRFPSMLKTMSQYTRTSHDDGIALARCYLPLPAGHNLLLASRLRLGDESTPLTSKPTLSITDRLNQVTTLSFPKETLEKALEMLATDLKIRIQIAGRDLQLEGITKNQTLSLDLRNRPAGEILVEVLLRANPDRTATGAADPRQKLVYVIRDESVIVTTRTAATQRGEELPKVFRVPKP